MTGVAKRGFVTPLYFSWSGAMPSLFCPIQGVAVSGISLPIGTIPDEADRDSFIPETMLKFLVYAVGQREASRGRPQPAVDDLDEAVVAKSC